MLRSSADRTQARSLRYSRLGSQWVSTLGSTFFCAFLAEWSEIFLIYFKDNFEVKFFAQISKCLLEGPFLGLEGPATAS